MADFPHVMIITGAGASAGLGRPGTPLPMMSGWASSLTSELGYAADLIGLYADMPGQKFEAALGAFLRFAASLPISRPFDKFFSAQSVVQPKTTNGNVHIIDSLKAFELADANVRAVDAVLRRNLFEQFSQTRVDEDLAQSSYHALHEQIRSAFDSRPVFLAHVTTNFDNAIEAAIDVQGHVPGDRTERIEGFVRGTGGQADRWAPNLLRYSPLHDGQIPVLHLHGAVGWYFTEDQQGIRSRPSNERYDDRMIPALLLPDDKKDIAAFPGPLKEVWAQFHDLLRNSTHVLVLGHSLHDPHLVKELKEAGKPTAVVVYTEPGADGSFDSADSDPDSVASLSAFLPDATLLAGKFGKGAPRMAIDPVEFKMWLRENRGR